MNDKTKRIMELLAKAQKIQSAAPWWERLPQPERVEAEALILERWGGLFR